MSTEKNEIVEIVKTAAVFAVIHSLESPPPDKPTIGYKIAAFFNKLISLTVDAVLLTLIIYFIYKAI